MTDNVKTALCSHCLSTDTVTHCPDRNQPPVGRPPVSTVPCGWVRCKACGWITRARDGKIMPGRLAVA